MIALQVQSEITIDAPVEIVRAQFADVAHHAATGVHRGVTFGVVEDTETTCCYTQTTRVGPVRLRQEVTHDKSSDGPLVNRIVAGQFAGGAITFDVTAAGHSAAVRVTLEAPISGPQRLVVPVLRRSARRALERALHEDKVDIESGGYGG